MEGLDLLVVICPNDNGVHQIHAVGELAKWLPDREREEPVNPRRPAKQSNGRHHHCNHVSINARGVLSTVLERYTW